MTCPVATEEAKWKDLFKRKVLALRKAGRFALKCLQKIAIQGDVAVGNNCCHADIQRSVRNFDLAGGIVEELPIITRLAEVEYVKSTASQGFIVR